MGWGWAHGWVVGGGGVVTMGLLGGGGWVGVGVVGGGAWGGVGWPWVEWVGGSHALGGGFSGGGGSNGWVGG